MLFILTFFSIVISTTPLKCTDPSSKQLEELWLKGKIIYDKIKPFIQTNNSNISFVMAAPLLSPHSSTRAVSYGPLQGWVRLINRSYGPLQGWVQVSAYSCDLIWPTTGLSSFHDFVILVWPTTGLSRSYGTGGRTTTMD